MYGRAPVCVPQLPPPSRRGDERYDSQRRKRLSVRHTQGSPTRLALSTGHSTHEHRHTEQRGTFCDVSKKFVTLRLINL